MEKIDPALLAAIKNVSESAPVRGGDYVVVDHNGKVQGKHKDSTPAIRQASKLEDDTGRVHQVHRVVDGKIEKSWSWSDSQQRYAPHTDYKGEDARHIVHEVATTVPTKFLGATYVGKIADSLNESDLVHQAADWASAHHIGTAKDIAVLGAKSLAGAVALHAAHAAVWYTALKAMGLHKKKPTQPNANIPKEADKIVESVSEPTAPVEIVENKLVDTIRMHVSKFEE